MKVIVGSNDLWPTPELASKILSIMIATDEPFAIRSRATGRIASGTEELVARIGPLVGRAVSSFAAEPKGSAAGFTRDVAIVKAASGVYAFFGPEGRMEGGTAHVVSCALRHGIPVIAYGVQEDGTLLEIGSDGGEVYRTIIAPNWGPVEEEVGWRQLR